MFRFNTTIQVNGKHLIIYFGTAYFVGVLIVLILRRQFLLLQRRFTLHRRCSFSFFWTPEVLFVLICFSRSPHLDWGLARGPLLRRLGAPRAAAASLLQVHFQCSCRRHRVVLWMPWLGAILPRPPRSHGG